jgi:superfamily II DNA or RNA helicase
MAAVMGWHAGDRVIVRGAEWRVLRSTSFGDCEALDLEGGSPGGTRTLLVPFDRPRTPPHAPLVVVSRRRWAHEVRKAVLSSFPYGGLRHCPPAVRLLPYQLEPALALLRHGATRVLVADDVGLGKTIEAGFVIRELAAGDRASRILILCPAALRTQWAREMSRLFDLQVVEAGAGWLRRAARELPVEVNPWSLPGIYLSSIDFVKRPETLRPLEDVRWDLLVVDEAHVATCGSDRRAAIDGLAARARQLVLLTATPHSGDDDQFRALCALGRAADDPLLFFSRERSETPLGPSTLRSRVLAVRLSDPERKAHRLLDDYARRLWTESERGGDRGLALVATVLAKRALSSPASLALSLRRRRDLLLAQDHRPPSQMPLPLPDDTIDDDAPDAVLGVPGFGDAREEARVLDALADAASEAARNERKLRALVRLVRRASEPVLVFSEFRDTAVRLHQVLIESGQQTALLHGGLQDDERERAVAALASGRSHLIATDTASEGLNLHHGCRLIVHFELPWTPARLHQRCVRVDRIGQTRRVHEIALVACDTSEQLVLAPLLARGSRSGGLRRPLMHRLHESAVAAHVLGGHPVAPSSFTLPPGTLRAELGDEAGAEVRRLASLRRLGRAGAAGVGRPLRRPSIIPVAAIAGCNAHIPPGLLVVFSLRVREATGAPLVQEVVVLSADRQPARRHPRASALRLHVQDALRELDDLTRVLDRLVADRVREVSRLREASVRLLRQRGQHTERCSRSAAEELVQAGLFDRRALRARAARRLVMEIRVDYERARTTMLTGDGHMEGTHELLAVLVSGAA